MDRLLPWLRRYGWAYAAAALVVALLAWRMTSASGEGGSGQPRASAAVRVSGRATPAPLLVHVAGAVRRPGVYRMPGDGRVIQALRRAGGPTRRADLSALNLAAPLQDGQQVRVPVRAPPGAAATSGPAAATSGPVSLSAATAADLEALDGIGPALAARIVAFRDAHGGFASIDQLLEVPGIGEARLESLRDQVVP